MYYIVLDRKDEVSCFGSLPSTSHHTITYFCMYKLPQTTGYNKKIKLIYSPIFSYLGQDINL